MTALCANAPSSPALRTVYIPPFAPVITQLFAKSSIVFQINPCLSFQFDFNLFAILLTSYTLISHHSCTCKCRHCSFIRFTINSKC